MLGKSEVWVTRDYGSKGKAVSLSKTRLGEFFFHLFSFRGELLSSHVMNPKYHGSYIQCMIRLPEGKREEFEATSGFTLEDPPVIKVA